MIIRVLVSVSLVFCAVALLKFVTVEHYTAYSQLLCTIFYGKFLCSNFICEMKEDCIFRANLISIVGIFTTFSSIVLNLREANACLLHTNDLTHVFLLHLLLFLFLFFYVFQFKQPRDIIFYISSWNSQQIASDQLQILRGLFSINRLKNIDFLFWHLSQLKECHLPDQFPSSS